MGATEKTCCYSYLGLFMFSHIWVLFPSVWLIVWWNRFLRCWESFTHTMPKWFKSPLQLEVSCQQFSKHLFYNGGLWGKCFWTTGRRSSCGLAQFYWRNSSHENENGVDIFSPPCWWQVRWSSVARKKMSGASQQDCFAANNWSGWGTVLKKRD